MKKDSKEQKKRVAHVVSHTHWDREWRYPIWQTRLMLVNFMDELIDVLESGKYPGFLLDGQVIPVLDYLEVKPEKKERVRTLVKSGKLLIGPWLLLPDEYPIDGESMIRNLLAGQREAKKLGKVFNVGYTSFGWGQTAQLPQIYAGFGIDVAMIGKRVSKERAPKSEFIWRAPDGSEMLTTRFGTWGRQNFYFKIHLSSLFGIYHEGADWRWDNNRGITYHRADTEEMEQDFYRLDTPVHWHPETITPELIEEAWATTNDSVLAEDRLMMNGCDYTASQPMFPEMVKHLNEVDPDPNRKWLQTTMDKFVQLMKRKIDQSKLDVVEGELRDGPAASLTGNALTTRLYLKRLNKKAQNMLIRFAEPMSVLAAMHGVNYPQWLINRAWRFLLNAHPHDSINGVTQDKTVRDVENRLDQVVDLSQTLGNRAMQELVRKIDMSSFKEDDIVLVVFNPLPYPRREVLEAWLSIPDDELFNTNPPQIKSGMEVYDADGNRVETQWLGRFKDNYPVAELHTRAFPYYCQTHRIFFDTGNIPAGGYKVFSASTVTDKAVGGSWGESMTITDTLLKAPNIMENGFLRVEMNSDGTFNLTDKRLNHTFYKFNYYEDRGEHGDYWVNKRLMFDQVHTSLGSPAKIWSEDSGTLWTTLVSEVTMLLPEMGDKSVQRRGRHFIEFMIKTSVTLRKHAKQVEVKVEFKNIAQDHYLRVMFPTKLSKATHADAGGHFNVDHRPIRPLGPNRESVWPDMATLPQDSFVDVSDGKIGIAFINDSLTEYEVVDTPERVVALSLLRSVKNWIATERIGANYPSQKGGQCIGHHVIRYAIRPHTGTWKDANIPLHAQLFNMMPPLVQTRTHNGELPTKQMSFFEIHNPQLRYSTIKKAEDRDTYLIRICNTTDERQEGKISFDTPLKQAWLTNLNERRESEITLINENIVPITAAPKKIVTIEIEVKAKSSVKN